MLQIYLWASLEPTKAVSGNIHPSPQSNITDTHIPISPNLNRIRMVWGLHNINALHKHPTT